jgi:hypothetical protein
MNEMKLKVVDILYFTTLTCSLPYRLAPLPSVYMIPPVMLALTSDNLERHVGLSLQAERKKFQHPL